MKNPDDANDYTHSKKEIVLICPCCKREYITKLVYYVKSQKVQCPFCKDGFSYPERFMSNVLKQLDIKFDYQYVSDWTHGYKYDFRLEYMSKKYIIEMDGAIGHNHTNSLSNLTKEDSYKIDCIKTELAIDNGYIVIRVDCDYKNLNKFVYIQNEIIKTISPYIDLSNVNWQKCHIDSLTSIFNTVINTYKYKTKFVDEISKITEVKPRTVIKYIKEAMGSGILPNEILYKKNYLKQYPDDMICLTNRHPNDKPILCIDDNLLFKSIKDACIYYGFNPDELRYVMRCKNNTLNGKSFKFYKIAS